VVWLDKPRRVHNLVTRCGVTGKWRDRRRRPWHHRRPLREDLCVTQVTPSPSDGNVQTEATVWVVRLGKPRRAPDVLTRRDVVGQWLNRRRLRCGNGALPLRSVHRMELSTHPQNHGLYERRCGCGRRKALWKCSTVEPQSGPAGSRRAVSVSAFFEGILQIPRNYIGPAGSAFLGLRCRLFKAAVRCINPTTKELLDDRESLLV
jgi:hypothetical protein